MPCDSSYLQPTRREEELQRAAKLLRYALRKLDKPVPQWVAMESENIYAANGQSVTQLCSLLTHIDAEERDALIYNARDKDARALADWWEEHQAADRERIRREAEQEIRKQRKKSALNKLTPEEKEALGIREDSQL